MLEKLKHRWQVNGSNLVLIICTFALGGSLCGFAGRKLMGLAEIGPGVMWIAVYIVLVTLLWPFCVLLVSIPLGQYSFFRSYLKKIWKRMSGKNTHVTPVAIFASGAGSNAEKIIQHSLVSSKYAPGAIRVDLVVCNKPGAGVLQLAAAYNIDVLLIEKERFFRGDGYLPELASRNIQFIVLAGFLWKVPVSIIRAFPNRIINIHPALLPGYGGKGMYGSKVHEAVIAAGEKQSGITIHYVDELFDHGEIIFQATCTVDEGEDADSLAQKIHSLEHQHYPAVIEQVVKMQNSR